jgi:hypothetical protein
VFLFPIISLAQTQDEWIDSLSHCESGHKENITVLDTNNKYSYGLLQFQLATFMGFGKQYGILPLEFTNKEGLLLIHNPYVQKAIAREMLDDGLQRHWLNCVNVIGNYPR